MTGLLVCAAGVACFGGRGGLIHAADEAVGLFEAHGDVGTVLHPGTVEFDAEKKTYAISGSGENMWSTQDGFQFAWKKVSGDVTVSADIEFIGKGVNEHRKAVLIVRQSLEADSPYVDAALHGSGLTSLQIREEKSGITSQIQENVTAPKRLRLEKRGAYFTMSVANEGEPLRQAGGSVRLVLKEPFYVGIGVCSHDKDVVEKAVFSNVRVTNEASGAGAATELHSTLEKITVGSPTSDRFVVYEAPGRFEAPNWMPDGKTLLFNRNGRIEKLPLAVGKSELVDTGFAVHCNNDHGISPDGKWLAISDQSLEDKKSRVYVLPIDGGTPKRLTKNAPSYWHGWSPDGKTLAFVGQRNDDFDIYTVPVEGGEETRLTTAKGLDDGPEYSPDGKYIYFNSERTGTVQIWRMNADGSGQEQVTKDEFNNWFPHISPDGERMVFLSYDKSVAGHPENKDVSIRMMSLKEQKVTVLVKLFGGQGTINVPSWSPDSKQIAFVSYQLLPKEGGGK
jgi:TolB protein